MLNTLDRAFVWVRERAFFYRFALFTRLMMAAAFIPTGMVKLLGRRFTLIGPGNPVGDFFEAMFQTGLYWQFIGLSQVLAGLLLLTPLTAHLGAALFFPIIVNIVVITVALPFTGTPMITVPMMLAVTYLCCWDWHRFRALFTLRPMEAPVPQPRLDPWERVGFGVFAVALLGFFGVTRSLVPGWWSAAFVSLGLAAGLFTLSRFLWLTVRKDFPAADPSPAPQAP
ncbi:MAG: DoxX family membrane protein [Rhodothermales bacterium]|nr:DoxX family membrane protein [Rhodothermales bacterium]MBO6780630.1 DoxX family membrane protein [Rhodothermales bacterium]